MTDTPTEIIIPGEAPQVTPRGATATGLPWPADTDPVMAGAQAIRALAEAVETKIQPGNPASVYEALRALGGVGVPITWTYDPAFGGGVHAYPTVNGRLQMVAVTVPKAYTCTGIGYVVDTIGNAYTAAQFNGFGLWQYAANGDATFLRDSGPTQGAFWTTAGWRSVPWVSPIQLVPGAVYLVGYQQQNNAGTNAQIRGIAGGQPNAGMAANALFQRSVGVAAPGSTQAAVMKTWPAASLVPYANMPLLVLY